MNINVKRACFKFGLGRELYSAPQIWVDSNVNEYNLVVSHISYNSNNEIEELEIKDIKADKVVFSWRNKRPIAKRPDFKNFSLKQERLENAVDKPTATSNEKTIVKGITDEQKAKLYQYLGSLTEEKQGKWYGYIYRKYKVERIDDLSCGDATDLLDYINGNRG